MSLLESFVTHTFQRATVSAIIVTTIVILNACSDNNEPVPTEEADFFTLTVESSFPTSDNDNWVLASTRSGEWIDFQRFESGETIVLKGAVSDISSFVLHFLRVPKYAAQVKYYISSIAEVPVNSTWVLKEPNVSADDSKVLTLNVTNLPDFSGPFNDALTVNLSEPSPG